MTAINDPLLLQLQYVNESYNLVFWVQQFEHYHKRHAAKASRRAYALARLCGHCADRALTDMVHYRDMMEEQGVTVPTLPNK